MALRIAANELRRQRALPAITEIGQVPSMADQGPSPEEQVAARQERQLLDEVLGRMPIDLRTVLVLFELEGLEVRQIAEIGQIPVGTASSRLRRAREEFSAIAKRVRTGLGPEGWNR